MMPMPRSSRWRKDMPPLPFVELAILTRSTQSATNSLFTPSHSPFSPLSCRSVLSMPLPPPAGMGFEDDDVPFLPSLAAFPSVVSHCLLLLKALSQTLPHCSL
eukprot:GGOE01056698.1.p1 GENE.GGOE01056698.1~~GGOE01056698.1.p1  ORF type:complete len:103 (+),score=8.63 GGOE01056698.1:119-427(+)